MMNGNLAYAFVSVVVVLLGILALVGALNYLFKPNKNK